MLAAAAYWLIALGSGRIDPCNPHVAVKCQLTRGFFATHENAWQIFGKMCFLSTAMGAGYHLRIIRKKAKPLIGMDNHMITVVTLKKKEEKLGTCCFFLYVYF